MSNQTIQLFPPRSVLRNLNTFHIAVKTSGPSPYPLSDEIKDTIRDVLAANGFAGQADGRNDAFLECDINVFPTSIGSTGSALFYAYLVRIELLTRIFSNNELCIVCSEFQFGQIMAQAVEETVIHSARLIADRLAGRLKESRL